MLLAGSIPIHATVRVTLMNMICEDNSYRSTIAAVDFTTAIQAELSADREIDWVERAEVEKTEAEFKLTGLGLIDRSEAIRSGRWVKADWAVFGRISTNSTNGRTLGLEIVDLQHADVLAATNLTLAPGPETHFKTAAADVTRAATALHLLLKRASPAQVGEPINVALLFLSPSTSGGALGDLEEKLRAALAVVETPGRQLRFIQFQRPGEAMDEANLVLAGLAQTDLNAWEKVADEYLWGEYSVRHRRSFDPVSQKWRDEQNLEITLNIWDGKSEPKILPLNVTNVTSSDAQASRLATTIVPLLNRNAAQPSVIGVRAKISESFTRRAVECARRTPNLWLGSREGLEAWWQVVRLLETACFFDPGNQTARELWLRVRWGRVAMAASQNEFSFARRRSEAWRRHVEQFKFQPVCPPAPSRDWWDSNSVASEFVLSAWRPYQMGSGHRHLGVPYDVGGPELVAWHRQFGEDLYSRLLAAPDDNRVFAQAWDLFYGVLAMNGNDFVLRDARQRQRLLEKLWPRILELQRGDPAPFDRPHELMMHFQQLGQPGGDKAWLAQLDEIARSVKEKARAQPVQLPRASTLDVKAPDSKVRP